MLERIKSTLVGLYPLDEVCNAVCLLEMYQFTDRIGAAWYGHKLLLAIDYLSDIVLILILCGKSIDMLL